MLSPGNAKLGTGRRIWSFSLPSLVTCPGRSATCAAACYSRRLEKIRPPVRRRYAANLALSRRPDFAQIALAALAIHGVRVLRLHVGGDFYSAAYARKWLRIIRRLPRVRFYAYTRSWRHRGIRPVLEEMARQPNCRLWYSCDEGTGLPARVPVVVAAGG